MRKFIATVLLVVMALSLSVSITATDNSANELEYAESRASSCLSKQNYVSDEELSICTPIPQYDLETGQLCANAYLIFEGSKQIGVVFVSEVNGQRYSTSYLAKYPILETAFHGERPIALYQGYNCLLATIGNSWYILNNPEERSVDYASIVVREGDVINRACAITLQNTRSAEYFLEVPFVPNSTSPADGRGICWAAAIASKIAYQRDISLTALELYNECWDTTDRDENNIPEGTQAWYNVAAGLYNISLSHTNGPISKSRVVRCLNNDKPFVIDIYRSTSTGLVGHAVTVCGFYEDADFYEFVAMDPNTASDEEYVYFDIPHSCLEDGEDFVYNNGQRTYTQWSYTHY